jgi:hypothetical protein
MKQELLLRQTKEKHNTTQKTKKMINTDPNQRPRADTCAREREAVPASYKTPTMLPIEQRGYNRH